MTKCPPKALLLDMDGVLYHGIHRLPFAAEFLAMIARVPHLFLTNNPVATPAQVAERLRSMGLGSPRPAQILTSGVATAHWLNAQCPGFRYFAVGAEGLDKELSRYGLADEQEPDYVVVGEGPGLDYASLTKGINLVLKQGAELISTNPDHLVDAHAEGQHQVLPGGGALVAAFEVACGVKARTIGKPQPLLFDMAMRLLGVSPAQCLMVGDRPDTDIAGAQRLGMQTAMVRTGRFSIKAAWPAQQPPADWDVAGLQQLAEAWGRAWPGWPPTKKPAGPAR